jgi:hypothetical protein
MEIVGVDGENLRRRIAVGVLCRTKRRKNQRRRGATDPGE